MRRAIAIMLLTLGVAAQDIPMPPPGNPGHLPPPPGAYCSHGGGEAHDCACQPLCVDNVDENGTPDGTQRRQEDNSKCRAACHPKHCHCPQPECEP